MALHLDFMTVFPFLSINVNLSIAMFVCKCIKSKILNAN